MSTYRERIFKTLGNRKPVEVLEATPKRLQELFRSLGPEGLKRSVEPGKWTAAQILCHLADAEMGIGFRLRQVLSEDNHKIQAFEQDDWAKRYAGLDAKTALDAQAAMRAWNLALIRTLQPEEWQRRAFHPERGEETVEVLIKMLAGHDLNHLAQIEQIAGQAAAATR
ncbi:MAG: DinB family protein [Acidobacteria bacterium]|nr:DinB family protein [Acidobacteriota bacterium]